MDRPSGSGWAPTEDHFRRIFDIAPDAMGVSAVVDGRLREVNQAYERLFAYQRADVIGRSTVELDMFPDPERRAELIAHLQTHGRVDRAELRIRRGDGRVIDGAVSARRFDDHHLLFTFHDLTAERHVQRRLAASEARLRSLVEATSEGIAMSAGGRLIDANDQLAGMVGRTRDELLGLPIVELAAPESLGIVGAAVAAGSEGPYEHLALRKDGSRFPVEVRARMVEIGGRMVRVSAIRDMSQRQAAELELRESEARFQQLAASIEDVFWLHDVARDALIYVSPAWEALTGQAAPAAVDRFAVVAADDRARVERTFRELGTAGPLRQEFRIVTAAGELRVVEERSFPVVDGHGRPYRIAGLLTDLSDRRRMEDTVHRAQRLEALGQLSSGVAHEFNNVIGSILFAVDELATLCQGDPDRSELCDLIVTAGERARDLTRQMLAFSRQGSVEIRKVDVNQLVWDTIAMLRRTVDRRVMVLADLRASPAVVLGDPAQLQGALLELGVRARDAMPDGGELTFETEHVYLDELACSTLPFQLAVGPYVRVKVIDNGPGLSFEVQERMFEPFAAGNGDGGGSGGSGLGLAAVYGTAVAHRGAVTIYSETATGTQCHLYLPVAPEAAGVLSAQPAVVQGSGLVLIVDDEPLLRTALARVLTSLGYTVEAAHDGADAVARFRLHHARCVAVLCDINMPRRSGPEVVRELRQIDPAIPVIMSSGFARDQTIARLGDLAVDGYLAKPVRRAELSAVLAGAARRV